MPTFETIASSLENAEKSLAKKCLEEMKHNKIIFSPGFEQNFDHLFGIYKMRYDIARELKNSSFNIEELKDWSNALNDLEISKADRLHLSVVQSESFVYFIFLEPLTHNLLAIFGGNVNVSIADSISINYENFNRGLTVSCIIYEFGNIIHEWKSV